MQILVRPSDLIKRFIWDKYKHFCLDEKNAAQINEIIENDLEFEISEEDAFVIGLTNVIYTSEVIYKFKQFLREVLDNKNFDLDNRLYINKQIMLDCITDFKNKIPKNWVNNDELFNDQFQKLPNIYLIYEELINNLTTIEIQEWPCIKCTQVKKVINKL